ncbi:MAG TPA: IS110 family transposase [Candidatus Acidoferrum sp.]|nr:IS110 family transposase [Candidatus Acidoferrum sp.]
MSNLDTCGIEISAKELVVRLRRGEDLEPLRNFTNTPEGHLAILRYLRRAGRVVRVCMESTGLYGLDLALALSGQEGIEVMVANPRAVRHFAQAMMKRSKNDQIDAGVLEQFAAHMPFRSWQRPSPTALALHALARRLRELVEMQTAEKNRQHAAGLSQAIPAVVRRDLARSLRAQERAIERLTRQARKLIAQDPQLTERFELLDSVPGIGETSAVQLLGELGALAPDLDARQWVAYAGLDPREYTSGTSVHKKPRISKAGNKHLRHALFMPALVAVQHDPHLRAFYQHLLARGKVKMQALVAVMRKLLHALHAMFKTHQRYDGSKLFRLNSTPAQEVPNALVAS